jgi:hypothetical protein
MAEFKNAKERKKFEKGMDYEFVKPKVNSLTGDSIELPNLYKGGSTKKEGWLSKGMKKVKGLTKQLWSDNKYEF